MHQARIVVDLLYQVLHGLKCLEPLQQPVGTFSKPPLAGRDLLRQAGNLLQVGLPLVIALV